MNADLEGEVHAWRFSILDLPRPMGTLHSHLSPDEVARAASFSSRPHRERFIAAHGSLRLIIEKKFGQTASTLQITFNPNGKPYFKNSPIQFNLSHSGDAVLIAVSETLDVGADVERMRPDKDPLALSRRFFTASEADQIAQSPPARQAEAFIATWCRKEALIKAIGLAVPGALKEFSVSTQVADAEHSVTMSGQEWLIRDLQSPPGYHASIAAAKTNWKLIDHGAGLAN